MAATNHSLSAPDIIEPNSYNTSTVSTTEDETNHVHIRLDILYGVFALNGIMACIGICGNAFVCLIIVRGRKLCKVSNVFLINLAVADICVLVISYPLLIIQYTMPRSWPFGSVLCTILPSISDSFIGISLGCITAIFIQRYRMIIHAMHVQLKYRQARLVIILIWFISLLSISAPLFPVMKYKVSNEALLVEINVTKKLVYKDCFPKWPTPNYFRYYQIYLVAAWYLLPLLIIFSTFIRIKFFLTKTLRFEWLNGSIQCDMRDHVLRIKTALRMITPVVILFSILMLPQAILRLVVVFDYLGLRYYLEVLSLFSATAVLYNSVVNPFVYYIMSREFRDEFREQLLLLKRYVKLTWLTGTDCMIEEKDGRRDMRGLMSLNQEKVKKRDSKLSRRSTKFIRKISKTPNFDEIFRSYSSGEYAEGRAVLYSVQTSSDCLENEDEARRSHTNEVSKVNNDNVSNLVEDNVMNLRGSKGKNDDNDPNCVPSSDSFVSELPSSIKRLSNKEMYHQEIPISSRHRGHCNQYEAMDSEFSKLVDSEHSERWETLRFDKREWNINAYVWLSNSKETKV